MSANAVPLEPSVEGYQESLTERMGRGRMPLAEALGYATRIAACLRDLHTQRLVYGAVSSQLILLGPSGATLRGSEGLRHLGDGHRDVTAFGGVLAEMVRRVDGPEDLCAELNSIAVRCQDEGPDMQQMLLCLRLLALRCGAPVVRRPVLVLRTARGSKPGPAESVRLRLHMCLRWKPLVNLAAFALSGK
jgi:hypothetical protein